MEVEFTVSEVVDKEQFCYDSKLWDEVFYQRHSLQGRRTVV